MYNDYKVWKQSRDEIDNKIKRLKTELDALKVRIKISKLIAA